MRRHRTTARTILALLLLGALAGTANAAVPRLVFPVVAKTTYIDDFGAPRGSGSHQGNDLMARKKSRVVAVEAGRVTKWTRSARAGCMLYLHGQSGTTYMYVHLNNDRTMGNDNRGGCKNGIAYAPGLASGQRVQAGQLIAFVGDSGDANGIAAHLHFELHPNGGRAVSPYRRLRAAHRLLYHRPATTGPLTARIEGTVVWVREDLEPDRVRVRVSLVKLSNGWGVRPARDVTLSVPSGAVVRRQTSSGTASTALGRATVGERVTVWTSSFPQNLWRARAPAGLHQAASILLRGS